MNSEQVDQVKTLTAFTAENFSGASFRNATRAGSRTVVIDVYTERGLAYMGAYVVYVDGRFAWYPVV